MMSENLKVLGQANVVSLRDEAYWSSCEQNKGVVTIPPYVVEYVEKATRLGLRPLLILNAGNNFYDKGGYPKSAEAIAGFVKYAETVVAAFKGKVKLYQLWNEWDITCGKAGFAGQGDPQSYVKLAAATYPRLKAIDPEATVMATSISEAVNGKFLAGLLDAGILKHCDAISYNAYQYSMPLAARNPEAYVARIVELDKLLKSRNNGKEFPIYLTESGCPTHTKKHQGSTEQESGDYIARAFLLIRSIPSVKGIWWYDFQDDGLNPEYSEANFGLVKTDLTPKESYSVLQSIAAIVNEGKFIERVKTADESLFVLKFKMPDGPDVLAAWSVAEDCNTQVTLKNAKGAKGPLKTFFAGFAPVERGWGMRAWATKLSAHGSAAPFLPDYFQFTVKSRPYIVMGDLSGVELATVERISFPDLQRRRVGFVKVPAQIGQAFPAAKPVPPVKFGGPLHYRSITGAVCSAKDLDAAFALSWEKDALKLVVEVTDDSMVQEETAASEAWRGDSVQIAFQNLAKDADPRAATEYILSLPGSGASLYRESSQLKLPAARKTEASLDVRRGGDKTVYTAVFPLSELGFKTLAPETIFAFSILVNDNDGAGREGYLHWGDGIGTGKDPSEYNWIIVKE